MSVAAGTRTKWKTTVPSMQPVSSGCAKSIEAMKEIWTKEIAEYHGEFINFDPMIARPKPVQKPHPPIHVGGAFPHGARRAIRYGDGWVPGGDIREVLHDGSLASSAMRHLGPSFPSSERQVPRSPADATERRRSITGSFSSGY